MTKIIVFKIKDMHCAACAMNIDGELEDTEGVLSAATNYAKAETKVEFDEEKIGTDRLLEAIKKAGYTVVINDKN